MNLATGFSRAWAALRLMLGFGFSLDERLEERVRQERAATRARERTEAVVGDRLQQV